MENKHFTITTRVYVEDTDYGGVVYHANYLRFMERARTELLIKLGFSLAEIEKQGYLFVIRKAQLNYLAPAKLGDLLEITVQVPYIGNSSITFMQEIKAMNNPILIYCQGELQLVCINKNNLRPTRIPQQLREKFNGT